MHLCSQRRNHPTPTQKPPNVTPCAIAVPPVRMYIICVVRPRPAPPTSGVWCTIHDLSRLFSVLRLSDRNLICSLSHIRIAFPSYCPYNTNQSTLSYTFYRIVSAAPSSARLGRRLCPPLRSPWTQGSRIRKTVNHLTPACLPLFSPTPVPFLVIE